MRYFYVFLLFILPNLSHAQKLLQGLILESETNRPVPAASVFLNNTSIGTTSNAQGRFELNLSIGKFDLVVSSVGFDTYSQTIVASNTDTSIIIKLQPKVKTLEAVVVEPFLKDGWGKWGKFFLESFIGTTAFAKDCEIKNVKAIKFRHSKENNELTAYAMEPLVIENEALGYTIHYQLENFTYNFKDRYVYYQGYPFFELMKGGQAKKNKWIKNRKKVYEGSILHFMRSLYLNRIIEEGFTMNYLKKVPNTEKQRIKKLYAKASHTVHAGNTTIKVSNGTSSEPDSSHYYSTIMKQADYFDVLNKAQLTGDSIAYAVNRTTAGLFFTDYLLIVYKKKFVPAEYQKLFPDAGTAMVSQVTLLREEPIEVEATGAYYHPANILSLGYWAWSEKIATMLPFDYEISNTK